MIPNIFHYYLIFLPDFTSSCGPTTGGQQKDDYFDDVIADVICNCPIPSYMNPTNPPDVTLDYSLKIGQIYPFNQVNSEPEGLNYTTTVSHKNCDIRYNMYCLIMSSSMGNVSWVEL